VTVLTISTISFIAQTTSSIITMVNSHLNRWETKGSKKATRGDEWGEPIKIPWGNLVYIPNWIIHISLLTRSRQYSYWTAIGPRNRVKNHSGKMNRCWQEHVRDWRQNSDQKSVHILTDISPNNLQTYSGNNRLKAIRIRKYRVFYPIAQEQYRLPPAKIHPLNRISILSF
jgi:hypothetical protein